MTSTASYPQVKDSYQQAVPYLPIRVQRRFFLYRSSPGKTVLLLVLRLFAGGYSRGRKGDGGGGLRRRVYILSIP